MHLAAAAALSALAWSPQPTNQPMYDVFNSTMSGPPLNDVFNSSMNDTAGLSYFCFRIPALVRTESALIAFAEGRRNSCGDAGDVRLVSRTSRDDGLTWSPIVQVQSETGHTIGNPAPIFDASTGQLHLLFSRDNLQLFSTFSSDEGASWSPRRNLTAALVPALDPAHAFVATGPPGGLQLASGRLVAAMYANVVLANTSTTLSYAVYSDDGGATWVRGAPALPGTTMYNEGEAQIAVYGSRLAMLMRGRGDFPRNAQAVNHNHALSLSDDGGATWSNSSLLHIQTTFCEGSIVGTAGGRLLISAPSTSNGGRANISVFASAKGGGVPTFAPLTTLYEGSSAYSSMLPPASVGADYLNLYEREGSKFLTLARFQFDEGGGW